MVAVIVIVATLLAVASLVFAGRANALEDNPRYWEQ